jgi:hypothetical protein
MPERFKDRYEIAAMVSQVAYLQNARDLGQTYAPESQRVGEELVGNRTCQIRTLGRLRLNAR